ncbi:anthocyanidin 3-O-glucosyltransferase 7-like [Juglans regia]|uniref:Glycosyltransferase n=1 Tax=Juglans regia TaxID=51240 RepID=A0A6P9F6L8_JUGRE|nr:anthocyanidin 3-O-glucosyltransferase 7-like [Juglans regia]
MSQSSGKNQHVAVLAFPFGCHPWLLLNLASKLASAAPDVRFSFLNTAKSNQKLSATSGAHLPHNLKFYDVADGVPEGHVLTPGNPLEELELFLEATPESFRKGMDMAVAETGQQKITCILSDAFLVFGCDLAADMHVKWVPLYVPAPHELSAHIYSALIHETYAKACGGGEAHGNGGAVGDLDTIEKTLDAIPGLSVMRFGDLPPEILQEILQGNQSNCSPIFARTLRRIREVLPRANAVVMNSFQELNSTILTDDLKSKLQDILYVGFLTLIVPTPPLPPSHSDATGCLPWLDEQKPTSVAYISFGTLAAVPPHEFAALAEALEASCVPFLWSLRENFKAFLPNGFLERTRKQGKIVPWAPQAYVLSHKAVGVYITHCGYNSVFESIVGEVPMICRPVLGDNKMNGRMVEDVWEIGLRVEGGVFTKKGMVKSLELVLGHDQHGRRMREKIRDLKELIVKAAGPDGIASKDFKTLLELISQ